MALEDEVNVRSPNTSSVGKSRCVCVMHLGVCVGFAGMANKFCTGWYSVRISPGEPSQVTCQESC